MTLREVCGVVFVLGSMLYGSTKAEPLVLWANGEARCSMVLPDDDERTARLAHMTVSRYLQEFYGLQLPRVARRNEDGVQLIIGSPDNNSAFRSLVTKGLQVTTQDIGDEGFELLSFEQDDRKFLVVYGRTPRAVKHACQELLFYRVSATTHGGQLDWPLKVVMSPQIAYRGIYMLPIWSAYDSLESWKRVLRFNSELTLNRVWFWLDGFPVAGHPASSHGTDFHFERTVLASDDNVQSLIDLMNGEDVKFYIGGGWMSWHHWEVVGQDREKAREYYFDYLRTFKGVGGFYFEPTGEGQERADWMPGDSLREMIGDLLRRDPQFEVAVAIGRFNNREYLELMSRLESRRVFWWWCWGNPHEDKALELYPSVLGWHTTVRMSAIHGTVDPPSVKDLKLAGMSTSYDPGMGYGNPWNGWAKMGVYEPRNFHPYTMPYFSHEYRFRERCWNPELSDAEFARRLSARLFDADMPPDAVQRYLTLADLCFNPASASHATIDELDAFVTRYAGHGTPRNRDTLARMAEAVRGLKQFAAAQ